MYLVALLLVSLAMVHGFGVVAPMRALRVVRVASAPVVAPAHAVARLQRRNTLQMNFFEDAFRFFANMKKEASAKHILIKGSDASVKLEILKKELAGAEDLSAAFSELASKVSECPSANRGGNLGTFKPGMMVKEFDKVCFEKEVRVRVHSLRICACVANSPYHRASHPLCATATR
jgi:peptidyl-prolyl cis-trans isomerase C